MPNSQDVLQHIEARQDAYLDELKDYLRIPSVSTDPAYDEDVRRCAHFVRDQLTSAGLTAELIETDGHPLVYGEWLGAPGKPTLLFYGHYDVQPPDPLELWRNDPFEPTVEGDELVARGATDDKGQSYAHMKAVDALLTTRGRLPINVKFLIEGEEESGGEAIEKFVRADGGRRLACDAVMVSDSSMFAPGQPSMIYGLKGLAYMELKVTGPNRDLHSGSFGGAVANPGNALAHIIAQLRDPTTGRITIPGFYDDVLPLEDWERKEFAALPFDADAYREELGILELFGEEGYTTHERVWARPTCDVNGIFGGYAGEGAKTVLPSWCGAKVSMRLVPNQDPDDIAKRFTEHVQAVAPPGVTVEVTALHGGHPVLLDASGPLVDAALAGMTEEWQRPVRVREGGSIPIVSTFHAVLDVPILLIGFGLSDDRLHSPNEKFNLSNYYGGIRAVVRILEHMGALDVDAEGAVTTGAGGAGPPRRGDARKQSEKLNRRGGRAGGPAATPHS
ncbi:MAG: dipeptidase, partial [Acidobacteriota bacterium]